MFFKFAGKAAILQRSIFNSILTLQKPRETLKFTDLLSMFNHPKLG